jgi:hypothetical protein
LFGQVDTGYAKILAVKITPREEPLHGTQAFLAEAEPGSRY